MRLTFAFPLAVHHKFVILDGRMIANGSFNWTRQAVLFNQENVVLSDNPALVNRDGETTCS
jgi:phosphatidylserine/phosphatidylglycerophosphate/cardiolipin synthase-like enzyme